VCQDLGGRLSPIVRPSLRLCGHIARKTLSLPRAGIFSPAMASRKRPAPSTCTVYWIIASAGMKPNNRTTATGSSQGSLISFTLRSFVRGGHWQNMVNTPTCGRAGRSATRCYPYLLTIDVAKTDRIAHDGASVHGGSDRTDYAVRNAKATSPTAHVSRIGRALGVPTGGEITVPSPTRRKIDFNAYGAANTFRRHAYPRKALQPRCYWALLPYRLERHICFVPRLQRALSIELR